MRLTMKPGVSDASTGVFFHARIERVRRWRDARRRRRAHGTISTSGITGARIEEVNADDALRMLARRRDRRDGERRRVRREHGVVAHDLLERCEQRALRVEILDDRLDDQAAVA